MRSNRSGSICVIAAIIIIVLGLLLYVRAGSAAEKSGGVLAGVWPCFQGANHDSISTESGWNASWPKEGPKQAWKLQVGKGYSSVAVVDGVVYTMGNDGKDKDSLFCIDAKSGKVVKQVSYACPTAKDYPGTRATPTVCDGLVYTLSREGHIRCVDAKTGDVKWAKDARKDFASELPKWGFAASPLILDKWVIFDVGTVVAMDRETGNVAWKSSAYPASYATPCMFQAGGRKCLAAFNAEGLVILDAANGKELMKHPWKTKYDINAATPIFIDGKLFISSGYGSGCAMLDLTGQKPAVVWQNKNMANQFATCALWKGYLYGISGQVGGAALTCMDIKDGAVKWTDKSQGSVMSLMLADGKLIVQGEKGRLAVAEATTEGYKELAAATPLGGTCWTQPVLADGMIYCRNSDGDLVCLDVSGK